MILYILAFILLAYMGYIIYMDINKKWPEQKEKKQ
jgi:hypothetical protein